MNATKSSSSAQVYVSTYNTYNEGSLKGLWIDLTNFTDCSDFFKHLSKLNKTIWKENDPEFMFQDYECFPEEYYYEGGMCEDIFKFIHEIDDNDKDNFTAFIGDWKYDNFEEDKEQFEERCTGHDNWEDFAYEDAEQMFDSTFLESGFFDYKAYERMLKESHSFCGDMIYRDY